MKVAIYYDSLVSEGGAERVVILLANYLHADIITSGYNPELSEWMPINGNVIDIGNLTIKLFKPLGILFEAPLRYLFAKPFDYDVNIYCGFTSIYNAKKNQQNIWYCLTPNRIMYDQRQTKLIESSFLKRLVLRLHILFFQKKDKDIIKKNIRQIISQSNTVQSRVKTYYNRDSTIINSPIDCSSYFFKEFGNFFLTVGRLFPEKRIDLIVDAFLAMPDKKLVIVGDGPDKQKILSKIKNISNISLLTHVTDSELKSLYASCLATIYMPRNEDYGLIPLESNASGKICIAANEGGCRETIRNGESGYLIEASVTSIIKRVNSFSKRDVIRMKQWSFDNAKKYDIKSIIRKWEKVLHAYE